MIRYTLNICRAMAESQGEHDYTYYYGYPSKKLEMKNDKGIGGLKDVVKKIPYAREAAWGLKGLMLKSNLFLSHRDNDVYFEPNFIPIKNVRAKRTVTTVHDFSFDLNLDWNLDSANAYLKKYFWRKIERTDLIITDSHYIKKEAVELFNMEPERIRPVHLGVDHDLFRLYDEAPEGVRLPENFIVHVGSIQPRKNIIGVLKAYGMLPPSVRKELKLVLVGFDGWKNGEALELAKKMGEDVFVLRNVTSDVEVARIYNRATLALFPSFYEGFGLPPLEAMACGCPVVTSEAASLPEVCGGAALYVNPHDTESIADGITKVASDSDLRQGMRRRGIEQAAKFSWEKAAREHAAVFEEALGN